MSDDIPQVRTYEELVDLCKGMMWNYYRDPLIPSRLVISIQNPRDPVSNRLYKYSAYNTHLIAKDPQTLIEKVNNYIREFWQYYGTCDQDCIRAICKDKEKP